MADESCARITRVVLKNYKSIVSCDVELRPLTILVGPNGSGKSNFVDALRFVQEALTVGLEQAIRNRGNVLRILSEGRPAGSSSFSIGLDFCLATGDQGHYEFQIEATSDGDHRVIYETLKHCGVAAPIGPRLYSITPDGSSMWASEEVADKYPSHVGNRLYLVAYSGMAEARPVYDLLTSMAFYDPSPAIMRDLRPRDFAVHLAPEGTNIGSMLRRIQAADSELLWRVTQYLRRVLPDLEAVKSDDLAGRDLLRFSLHTDDVGGLVTFDGDQMSDGTLRALGVLVALFQHRIGEKAATSLVAIEEPEAGLHPATGGALFNAILDASETTQVLVTTHGATLLDTDDVAVDSLLAVVSEDGVTRLGPVDQVGRSIVRDQLFTVGELLAMEQLRPEPADEPPKQAPDGAQPVAGRP